MIQTMESRAPRARQAKTEHSTATMRAAAIDAFGGPEVLTIHTLPVPNPDALEVLIALDTSGVGVWDAEMRAGWVPSGGRARSPLVLGTDGAGIVAGSAQDSSRRRWIARSWSRCSRSLGWLRAPFDRIS